MAVRNRGLMRALTALAGVSLPGLALAGPPAAPAAPAAERPASVQSFERLPGFAAVVMSHIAASIGLDVLPAASGFTLEAGVFVTLGLDRVQVFDRDVAPLQDGRTTDTHGAPQCAQLCPSSLFDAFQAEWLALAIESSERVVEIPNNVVIAAHGQLPAETLLAAAYAAASARPLRPPSLALVLGSSGRGLQGQPFMLLPPQGLELGQGSAALGLQLHFTRGRYLLRAEDPGVVRAVRTESLAALRAALREIKKRHPGKQAIIVTPGDGVNVGDLVEVMVAVRADFPRIVLSAGQDVILP